LFVPMEVLNIIGSFFRAIVDRTYFTDRWRGPEGYILRGTPVYNDYWFVFAAFPVLYVIAIFGGQYLMRNRKEYNLRKLLIAWNTAMFTFSLIGTFHTTTVYSIMQFVNTFPNFASGWVCGTWCYVQGNPAAWVFFFNMSKVFEFFDTVFLVLRKRPVIFLHWYHHIITYLFCWYSNQNVHYYTCNGYLFAWMNYTVHTFMYGYYLLRALRFNPPVDFLITILQILQMVIGIIAVLSSSSCENSDFVGVLFGFAIYVSFFVLFLRIFIKRYFLTKPVRPTQKSITASSVDNLNGKTKKE